eukprot:1981344-Rhodomonas_salina.1
MAGKQLFARIKTRALRRGSSESFAYLLSRRFWRWGTGCGQRRRRKRPLLSDSGSGGIGQRNEMSAWSSNGRL